MSKVNTRSKQEKLIEENNFLRQRVVELEELESKYKRENKELKEHNSKLNDIFSSLKDLVFVLDKDGVFTDFYVPNEEMYLPPEEFIGRKHSDVIPHHISKLFNKALEKNKDGKVDEYEYPLEIAGKNQWYHVKQSPLFSDGQFTGAVAVIRNITEHKQTYQILQEERARFTKLLEYAPVGILEVDYSARMTLINSLRANGLTDFYKYFNEHPDVFIKFLDGRLISLNRASLEFYEVDLDTDWDSIKRASDNLLSHSMNNDNEEVIHLKSLMKIFSQLIDNKAGTQVEEVHKRTVSGKNKYFKQYYYAMPGHKDDLSWVVIIQVDITDRVLTENELKRYQNHLEDLIKERTSQLEKSRRKKHELYQSENTLRRELEDKMKQQVEFTRALVHELKTPLTPLLLASDLLTRESNNKLLKDIAKTIKDGANALDQRVNELLDVARGEIGILKIDIKSCNLSRLIKEVGQYMSYVFQNKEQHFSMNVPKRLPAIEIDAPRIRQVLVNLLDNASKFTPQNGDITLTIKKYKEYILVEVRDTGLGIPPENINNIFLSYYTLKQKNNSDHGIGLGLALSKMLIELHSGSIWVKSINGKGSIFSFSLPLRIKS